MAWTCDIEGNGGGDGAGGATGGITGFLAGGFRFTV
jgi:hypothetical protein